MVGSPTSPTPTQSLSEEGDLDTTKGHSQPSVGTLPLTEKDPPGSSENINPPPSSSIEGLDTQDSDPSMPESLDKMEESHIPSSPPHSSKSEEHPSGTSRDTSVRDPFSSFWSGQTGEDLVQSEKRYRWLIRKLKRRHSFEDVLKRDRQLVPGPRYYSRQLDAREVSFKQVDYILRYLVQQKNNEREQLEKLEKERGESKKKRQFEIQHPFVQHDKIDRPRRLIPVEPILSPFEIEERRFPGENPLSPQLPYEKLKVKSKSKNLRPHKDSTSSESSADTEPDSDMAATDATKDLIEALTKTLKNINQSPTIPLPVFKGKKGEDPEDHILKVEDYFGLHQIDDQQDKIKRFKDTLFETARKWAQTLNYTEEVVKFDHNPAIEDDKKASMKYFFLRKFTKEGRTLEAAYSAWGSLTFDSNKDDIEQFIQKVEELAKKLGYNEDAQVMAVKSVLPRLD